MWEAIKDIGKGIVESRSALLVIAGVLLLVAGAAGGLQYQQWLPISDPVGRYVLMVSGGVVILLGVFVATIGGRDRSPNAETSGFRITHPRVGEKVGRTVDVHRTFKEAPPRGYEARLLRFYDHNRYYPIALCSIGTDGTWHALQCDLSEDPTVREIGVYLVGPSGQVLLNYHKVVDDSVQGHIPLLRELTTDMIKCHRVEVRRA